MENADERTRELNEYARNKVSFHERRKYFGSLYSIDPTRLDVIWPIEILEKRPRSEKVLNKLKNRKGPGINDVKIDKYPMNC